MLKPLVWPTTQISTFPQYWDFLKSHFSDEIAFVVSDSENTKYTYKQFYELVEKQMSFIETHSKFQNYVMILLKNNFHTIVSMYACLLLGRVCLVPPSEIGGNLLKEKCDSYHPDLLITEECYVADITHYNIDTPYTFYPQTFGTEKINYHNNLIQPNSPAVLFTTSGSTGTPKEFIVNHQYLTCQIRPDFLFFKTIYDSNIQFDCHRMLNELLVAPVNTTAGFAFQIVTCLALPQTVVIAKWTPKNFSEIIDLHDINVIYAIPKMFSLIEQYLASTGKTHSKLKLVIAGGGKWHETTLFQDYDILFAMTYGSSEAQCISWYLAMPNDKDYKLQHCGKPAYKDIDIRFDESNNLEVKSPYMITSFIDSNITNTYFTTDGWFRMFDKMHLDELGNLVFEKRIHPEIPLVPSWKQ